MLDSADGLLAVLDQCSPFYSLQLVEAEFQQSVVLKLFLRPILCLNHESFKVLAVQQIWLGVLQDAYGYPEQHLESLEEQNIPYSHHRHSGQGFGKPSDEPIGADRGYVDSMLFEERCHLGHIVLEETLQNHHICAKQFHTRGIEVFDVQHLHCICQRPKSMYRLGKHYEEHACNKIQALAISDARVVVGESYQHLLQIFLATSSCQSRVRWKRSVQISLDLLRSLLIKLLRSIIVEQAWMLAQSLLTP
mmetsp:Transcript_48391/g.115065  ORF Transcript_48391/g.115065 Transcript_48391/m.115065 type:complete len:249 (-) Transcript_48391:255-1001(-)